MAKALATKKILPETWDRVVESLAEGTAIHLACQQVGVSRQSLANHEMKDGLLKKRIRDAAASGARFRIDEAAEAAKNATTKDQALMARIRMEAEARRAELIAPTVYGKQSANLPQLPAGTEGMLTVRWLSPEEPKTIEHTPADQPAG